jgi:rsbT co-antagonist protein RsbR
MSEIAEKRSGTSLVQAIAKNEDKILADWLREMGSSTRRSDLMKDAELRNQCRRMLDLLKQGLEGGGAKFDSPQFDGLKDLLADISHSRALQGFSATDTAIFVFSIKRPLLQQMSEGFAGDTNALTNEFLKLADLVDAAGLYTTSEFMRSREEVIRRQQQDMLELSTPVVKLWDNILALPLIGTLDSARTQIVMETLLQSIVQTNSRVAIIDITGVPTVDTIVAQHLLKTVTAARLMGADCIISGVRPQIAQTIVHLGINLLDVTTKATLSDAFAVALQKTGVSFERLKRE